MVHKAKRAMSSAVLAVTTSHMKQCDWNHCEMTPNHTAWLEDVRALTAVECVYMCSSSHGEPYRVAWARTRWDPITGETAPSWPFVWILPMSCPTQNRFISPGREPAVISGWVATFPGRIFQKWIEHVWFLCNPKETSRMHLQSSDQRCRVQSSSTKAATMEHQDKATIYLFPWGGLCDSLPTAECSAHPIHMAALPLESRIELGPSKQLFLCSEAFIYI